MMRIKAVTPAQQAGGQAVTALQKTTLHNNLGMLSLPTPVINIISITARGTCYSVRAG